MTDEHIHSDHWAAPPSLDAEAEDTAKFSLFLLLLCRSQADTLLLEGSLSSHRVKND